MKALGYLSALAAAGALGAAVLLACSNPAVVTPPNPPTPPQGALTLVYGTNNRIEVIKGNHLTVIPTLTPRAAKVKYSTEGAPDWLNIHPDLGIISADARQIQGAFSSAAPPQVRQDFRFRITAAGSRGAYAKQSVTVDIIAIVKDASGIPPRSFPAGLSYFPATIERGGSASVRVRGAEGVTASYAFDTAGSAPPPWLTINPSTGVISITDVPADTPEGAAAYRIKVTGTGRYAGVPEKTLDFVLTVRTADLPDPLGLTIPGLILTKGGSVAERSGSAVPIDSNTPNLTVTYSYSPINTGGAGAKPSWLTVNSTTGTVTAANAADTDLPDVNGTKIYRIRITGTGIYAGKTADIDFVISGSALNLPAGMAYPSRTTVAKGGSTTVNTTGTSGVSAAYAFNTTPPYPIPPSWLTIVRSTGEIQVGTVPADAAVGEETYKVIAAGTGAYQGKSKTLNFVLQVNPAAIASLRYSGGDVTAPGGVTSLRVTASTTRNINVPLQLGGGVNASHLDFSIAADGVWGDAANDLKTKTGLDFSTTGHNAGRITGTPSVVLKTPTKYTISARGKTGTIYEGTTPVTEEITITVNAASLPAMSYAATSVSRGGNAAARGISVGLSGGLPAAQADYAFEPASSRPSWLNISSSGTIWGTVPTSAPASATYTIKVTGKSIYAGETRNVTFTLRAASVPLPTMSYAATSVSRGGNAAARGISVGLSGGLPAAQADYAFEPASSRPSWLNISSSGTIWGTVPTSAPASATYTIKVTGKGIYAGTVRNVTFTLRMTSVSLPAMSYAATNVARGGSASVTISGAGGITVTYAFDTTGSNPAPPSWLTINSNTGALSVGSGATKVPTNTPTGTTTYRIKVTGNGIYLGETRNISFTLRVTSVPLPGMSYAAKTVSRAGNTAARTISVPLTNGLPATQADYAFEPPSSKPAWLSIGDTGTISGVAPTNATLGSTTYTVKVTGKGIYAGETGNVTFTLNVVVRDFDTLGAAGNRDLAGIWSDGTTMWVADYVDDKIYAYSMSTKARDSTKDFGTLGAAENRDPTGIWSDGTTMWVADWRDEKIYAYSMSTKERDISKDFNTLIAAGNRDPRGLWSDGTTMWVTDKRDDKIYAYSMSTKESDSAKDFNTLDAAWNNNPRGIWSDGTTMWVGDWIDGEIYAYSMSSKERESTKEFNTYDAAGNRRRPTGIWSDGTTMWVADSEDAKIYAYSMATKARTP